LQICSSKVTSSSLYGYGFSGFCGALLQQVYQSFLDQKQNHLSLFECSFYQSAIFINFSGVRSADHLNCNFKLSSVIVIEEAGMLFALGLDPDYLKNAPSEPSLLLNTFKTSRKETEEISACFPQLVNFFSSFF